MRWDVYAMVTEPDADAWEMRLAGGSEGYVPIVAIGRGLFLVDALIDSLGMPSVAMVRGPEGRGRFVRPSVAAIDVEERDWSFVFGADPSDATYWSYDANTTMLEIRVSAPMEDPYWIRYDVRNREYHVDQN